MSSLILTYERVSSDKQDIARQARVREQALAEFPEAEHRVIQDDGVSAYKVPIFDRPGGGRVCELVQAGKVAAIFTDEQSRLSRGEDLEWVTFRTLCDQQATRIFIDGREVAQDMGGKLLTYLGALLANEESRVKSHRVKTGKALNARRGRPNGGPRRYGFEKGAGKTGLMLPVPDEIALTRRMAEQYVGGMTQKAIAIAANEAGARTARGKLWNQTQVSQCFDDPIWDGRMKNAEGEFPATFLDPVTGEQYQGPLWPEGLFDAVQATRAPKTGKRTAGRRSTRFLLANGMLKCTCGASMRGKCEKKDYGWWEAYICAGRYDGTSPDCRQVAVRRESLDTAVMDYFAKVGLDVPAMIADRQRTRDHRLAQVDERIANAEALADAAERKMERLDQALSEDLEPADYKRAIQGPKRDLAAAQGALKDLRDDRLAVEAEPDLADAEQEVLEQLADLRASVAGEVTASGDLSAAQAALRRTFSAFLLTEAGEEHFGSDLPETLTGYLVEPVVRPEMLDLKMPPVATWMDLKRTALPADVGNNARKP
jgi:DNA invertase Pin-like site-specific DNA recombinase